MNLYRLDYIYPDGSVRRAVYPEDVGGTSMPGMGDFLTTSYRRAREAAIEASGLGEVVRVSRIGGRSLVPTPVLVVGEDGRAHRP